MKQKRLQELTEKNAEPTMGEVVAAAAFTIAILAFIVGLAVCAAVGFVQMING